MRPLAADFAALRRRLAGEHEAGAGGVVSIVVRHRADDAELGGPLRELRQVLANLNSRNLGRNRLKRPPDLLWLIGLHVPGVLMSRPAPHEEQNAGFGFAKRLVVEGGRCFAGEELRQSEPKQASGSRPQNGAPVGSAGVEFVRKSGRLHDVWSGT